MDLMQPAMNLGGTRRGGRVGHRIIGVGFILLCACAHVRERNAVVTSEEDGWADMVKQSVGSEWSWPRVSAAIEKNDPECRYLDVDRRTVIEYVVDAGGVITSERVKESGGVPYLDQLALDAFASVHHVPPPPPQLAGKPLLFAFRVRQKTMLPVCAQIVPK